jgi:hypothetical protein
MALQSGYFADAELFHPSPREVIPGQSLSDDFPGLEALDMFNLWPEKNSAVAFSQIRSRSTQLEHVPHARRHSA